MRPGEKLVYYPTGPNVSDAMAAVEARALESHEPIWASGDPKKAAENDPFRVPIAPDLVLPEAAPLPAEPVARRMTYVATWPAANRTLAFQEDVHEIGPDDDEVIRAEMAARLRAKDEPDGRRIA